MENKNPLTVFDIKQRFFSFFLENSIFRLSRDIEKLGLEKDDSCSSFLPMLVASALDNLCEEENPILRKIETPDDTYWILERPLTSYEREVTLGFNTCLEISSILRKLSFQSETLFPSDPTNIQESDIQKLVMIVEKIIDQNVG